MGDRKVKRQLGNKLFSSIFAMMVVITTIFTNDVTGLAATNPAITLSSKQENIAAGKSVQLKVKAVKGLKSKSVIWKSSNGKVAKVSSKGKVTGLKAGTAKITATSKVNKKVKATCKITVKKDAVETIRLDKTACVVVKGKNVKVKVQDVVPATASFNVTWKINKSSVAKVTVKGNTATIKGKKTGKATLTATAADGSKKTAKVEIVVVDKKSNVKKVTGIQISLAQNEVLVGESTKAKAAITPSNATLKTVLWSSSDEKIAKIDGTGKITALQAGQVTITATAQDGSGKKGTVTLVVKENVVPTEKPEITEEPKITEVPTIEPTEEPKITKKPTIEPVVTEVPIMTPTQKPEVTEIPTVMPTEKPEPTTEPTEKPETTETPIATPTTAPVVTAVLTTMPTVTPTIIPSVVPTTIPTVAPTQVPTIVPTHAATIVPTQAPTTVPTQVPTIVPTQAPTAVPTQVPTIVPTQIPTITLTQAPTVTPTLTQAPTVIPTTEPQVTETPTKIWYENVEEAGKALRNEMKKRKTTIELKFKASEANEAFIQTLVGNIAAEALKHTGVSTEGDYIEKQMGGYQAGISYYSDGSAWYLTITYNVVYYTTAQQEAEVDAKIAEVIQGLNLDGKSDYEKVKAIYDYICKNVTYDNANLNDESHKLKYTAYAALINKTSVCQGYANLLYRMLLEAGVDSRIITGVATDTKEGHAWNIVKLDDTYYYLDATWDATRTQNNMNYNYFLRGISDFDNHTLDSEFEAEEFKEKYSVSEYMYQLTEGSE